MSIRRLLPTVAALLAIPASVHAIQPGRWVQSTEAEFDGENDNTVVTNFGDVKLAADTEVIAELSEQASIIYDIQIVDGVTYLAAGPEGKLLKKDGDEVSEVAELKGEQVFTLDVYAGNLLVAISGVKSRLALLGAGDELTDLVTLEDVRYVWDVIVDGDVLYVATGTDGKVLRIDVSGDEPDITDALDAEQANVLCLAARGRDTIYAGTDTDGLVYRLTRSGDDEWETFVVYDAAEPEIGALLVTDDGTIYAGTADANQARPGRLDEAVEEEAGRPETIEVEVIEGEEDEAPPKPDDLPDVPPAPDPMDAEQVPPVPETPQPLEEPEPMEPVESTAPSTEQSSRARMSTEAVDTEALPTDADAPPTTEEEPTQEQRDRLRELVRARLDAARKSGKLQAPGGVPGGGRRATPTASRTAPGAGASAPQEGNAIYRIDPEGFVSEVFRESVMILKLVDSDGQLLVATGNEGQIYRVDPDAGETTIIAELEPEQVPAMLPTDDGVLLGTANPAELVRMTEDVAARGTYTSSVMDANQISLWGAMHVTAEIPDDTSLTVETRSGNVQDPEEGPWSPWSESQVLMPDAQAPSLQPRQLVINAPPARFLQYRLTLIGDKHATPVVDRVESTHVTPNLRPKISSLKAAYPEPQPPQPGEETPPPSTTMTVEWEATDPNNDSLLFTLEYQPAGTTRWIEIAEDLEQPSYEWDTRRVPDGWYLLHVIASDRQDNPPDMALTATRRSNPVLVDNSAPALEDLEQTWTAGM